MQPLGRAGRGSVLLQVMRRRQGGRGGRGRVHARLVLAGAGPTTHGRRDGLPAGVGHAQGAAAIVAISVGIGTCRLIIISLLYRRKTTDQIKELRNKEIHILASN